MIIYEYWLYVAYFVRDNHIHAHIVSWNVPNNATEYTVRKGNEFLSNTKNWVHGKRFEFSIFTMAHFIAIIHLYCILYVNNKIPCTQCSHAVEICTITAWQTCSTWIHFFLSLRHSFSACVWICTPIFVCLKPHLHYWLISSTHFN